jgi:hypothetical protein
VASEAADLRAGVTRMLQDQEAARQMGCAARARLEADFPISQFRDSWLRLAQTISR